MEIHGLKWLLKLQSPISHQHRSVSTSMLSIHLLCKIKTLLRTVLQHSLLHTLSSRELTKSSMLLSFAQVIATLAQALPTALAAVMASSSTALQLSASNNVQVLNSTTLALNHASPAQMDVLLVTKMAIALNADQVISPMSMTQPMLMFV